MSSVGVLICGKFASMVYLESKDLNFCFYFM